MRKTILTITSIVLVLCLSLFAVACAKPNYNDYFVSPTGKLYQENNEIFNIGYGTNNNGQDKNTPEMDRLTSVVPSERQLDYLELEFYSFIHFGMNTFTNREWGTGKEKPSKFNPKNGINTDQWCEAIKASGSKGIIFTAKHHDGFCLWQTDTTEHSIKNSPYKNGKGDIVKELSDSCKKYGLKFGVYLSPWDMNCPIYGTNAYNDFFKKQLTELLDGRYGDIFSIWFDGARGKDAELDPDFEYDMKGYEEIIRKLQPNCVSALQGSDVRWVGNEAGVSRENEWSVISNGAEESLKYQDDKNGGAALQEVKYNAEDVGSRELLSNYKDLMFKPSEVDVSIHQGWFYHSNEKPKELDHLMKIYNKAVGGNSSLLLNVCPSKNGIIEKRDANRLKELGDAIKAQYANPVNIISVDLIGKDGKSTLKERSMEALLSEDRDSLNLGEEKYILDFNFAQEQKVSRIDIREDMRFSHRVELYDIYIKNGDSWELLANAGNIGNRRSIIVDPEKAPTTTAVRIVFKQARKAPIIRFVGIYA